ncbi:MAG: VanZ family protein [Roseinatronobacter sp.]|nr:VanZ family protein [Roseinatronobacter sp.]
MRFTSGTERTGLALSALLGCAAMVLLFMPMSGMPSLRVSGIDKLVHFLMFFAIALPGLSVAPRIWIWFVPLLIGYGGMIELVQPSFGRGREWADFAANSLGVITAIPVGRGIFSRWLQARQL